MNKLHHITKIVKVGDLSLLLEFDNIEIRLVDLSSRFKAKSNQPDSKFKELLDTESFKKVHLHPEWETIYWENGIDLDPDVLYDMSVPVNQVN